MHPECRRSDERGDVDRHAEPHEMIETLLSVVHGISYLMSA